MAVGPEDFGTYAIGKFGRAHYGRKWEGSIGSGIDPVSELFEGCILSDLV